MPDALESLKTAKKVVVCKQTAPLALEATMQGIEIVRAPTMTALGRHCGISVSAACAAIVR